MLPVIAALDPAVPEAGLLHAVEPTAERRARELRHLRTLRDRRRRALLLQLLLAG